MFCVLRDRCRIAFAALLAAFVLFALSAPDALAQSSVGAPANAAIGRSLADAVDQNQRDLINFEVLGASVGSTSGAGVGVNVSPTGRVRTSSHGGLEGSRTFAFDADEASGFANVMARLPEKIMGGQVKLSGIAGYNLISLDVESNGFAVLDPNQFGGAENGSVFVGGTALWAMQSTYALVTAIGFWGETRIVDSIDDCGNPGCNLNRYDFDTAGFIGMATAGHVFDLSSGASAPKLDLRGTVAYVRNDGDVFENVFRDEQEYSFSTWTGTIALTLFSNMVVGDGASLSPYVQGYVRHEWDYESKFAAQEFQGPFLGVRSFEQAHTYGGVDAGLTYSIKNAKFGGSIYGEASSDEATIGGRIGATFLLN